MAISILVVGCSSKSATNDAEFVARPVFDETVAKSALLLPEDLGPTWAYERYGQARRELRHAADENPGTWGIGLCQSAQSMSFSDPTWAMGSALIDIGHPLTLRESITIPADSIAQFQLIRDAFDSCTAAPWTAGTDSKTMESIPSPQIADESTAHVMTTTSPDIGHPNGVSTTHETTIAVRRGPTVEIYEFFDSRPEPETNRHEEIVSLGDEKVRAALDGTLSSTTTSESTTTITSTTTSPPPRGTGPTCAQVQRSIALMSPADLAILRRAPMLFFSRPPDGGDGWRISALGDVTGRAPRPDVAVYYDWTVEGGLGPPVVIKNSSELDSLIADDTSITLLAMNCLTTS